MESREFQNILSNYRESEESKKIFSLEDIRNYRKKYMAGTTSSLFRLLIFDTIYKIAVAAAYIVLIFEGSHGTIEILISAITAVLLLFLCRGNLITASGIRQIDNAGAVFNVLLKKYKILHRVYSNFLFSSALTNLFFVLAGFRIYTIIKYGQDKLLALLSDPVTCIFLALALVIPFFVQRMNFARELRDLKNLIDAENDANQTDTDLSLMKRKRRIWQIIFILLIVLGFAIFMILL